MITGDERTCPRCAALVGAGRFCPNCGASLHEEGLPALAVGLAPAEVVAAGESPNPQLVEGAPAWGSPPGGSEDGPGGAGGSSASSAPAGDAPRSGSAAGGGSEPWLARLGRVSPEAGEFASAMVAQARAPGVVVAVGSALSAGSVLWLAGLLMSFLSYTSILGSSPGVSHVKFAFLRAADMTLALDKVPGAALELRVVPGTLVLLTLAALAVPAWLLASRTRALSDRERVLWGCAAAIPFALVMLLCAVIAGTVIEDGTAVKVSAVGSFLLGLLWGAVGGGVGVAYAIRRERGSVDVGPLPGWVPRAGRVLGAALRPLLVTLALCAVVGTVVWMTQSVRNAGHQRTVGNNSAARSTGIALFDDATFALDNGVHLFELGSGVSFHQPGFWANGMPLPATKVSAITGAFTPEAGASDADLLEPAGTFRIFDYGNGLPALEFVVLLLTFAVPILSAAYGGFALARSTGARTAAAGAGWGALLGPIWCVAMVVLNGLVQKQIGGKASGNDVLVIYLLAGAALGAIGGLLAVSRPSGAPVLDVSDHVWNRN